MDLGLRKRLQKTLYSGELETGHCPLALTDLAVEFFQGMSPHKLGHIDLETSCAITGHDGVSPASITMSMMYAKRLQRKRPEYVMKMSSSELFIISMMMASKYLYDEGVDEEVFNDEWAENAGLETKEINDMEMDFLQAVDWELFVHKEDFKRAMYEVERRIALKEGKKRGWFSYTDLDILMDEHLLSLTISDVGVEWLKVVMVSSAAYLAGLMMMVGSTVLVTNASLVLSTPGLIPAIHNAFPAVSTPLAALTYLPFSTDAPEEFGAEMMQPKISGFDVNHTVVASEKEEKERSVLDLLDDQQAGGSKESGPSVLDTILSQLVAVLTIKSHLVQFLSAVSHSYSSVHYTDVGNRSSKKFSSIPSTFSSCLHPSSSAHLETEFVGKESCCPTLQTTVCFEALGFSADVCALPSGNLRSGCSFQGPINCGCEMDRETLSSSAPSWDCMLNRDHAISGDHGHEKLGRSGTRRTRSGLAKGWPELSEAIPGCCQKEKLSFFHNLFPDITVGFTTSMPPVVYAA